jgi:hypothetical protein
MAQLSMTMNEIAAPVAEQGISDVPPRMPPHRTRVASTRLHKHT